MAPNGSDRENDSRKYGWKRDLPDFRDSVYDHTHTNGTPDLAVQCDLRAQMPPVYDQGKLGSCTANALAACYEFAETKEGVAAEDQFRPSRLFIYYNERDME